MNALKRFRVEYLDALGRDRMIYIRAADDYLAKTSVPEYARDTARAIEVGEDEFDREYPR